PTHPPTDRTPLQRMSPWNTPFRSVVTNGRRRINSRFRLPRFARALCGLPALLAALGCRVGPVDDGPLVVAIEAMPQDLDPRFASDAPSPRIGALVFRSLTRLDDHGRHLPDVAEDWRAEDERTTVFHLRSDAAFEDGSPLTADDVRATYQSVLDPATASPKR